MYNITITYYVYII